MTSKVVTLSTVRELDKVLSTVNRAVNHHETRDRSNAELHMSDVRYSPLTVSLQTAMETLIQVRNDISMEVAQHEVDNDGT